MMPPPSCIRTAQQPPPAAIRTHIASEPVIITTTAIDQHAAGSTDTSDRASAAPAAPPFLGGSHIPSAPAAPPFLGGSHIIPSADGAASWTAIDNNNDDHVFPAPSPSPPEVEDRIVWGMGHLLGPDAAFSAGPPTAALPPPSFAVRKTPGPPPPAPLAEPPFGLPAAAPAPAARVKAGPAAATAALVGPSLEVGKPTSVPSVPPTSRQAAPEAQSSCNDSWGGPPGDGWAGTNRTPAWAGVAPTPGDAPALSWGGEWGGEAGDEAGPAQWGAAPSKPAAPRKPPQVPATPQWGSGTGSDSEWGEIEIPSDDGTPAQTGRTVGHTPRAASATPRSASPPPSCSSTATRRTHKTVAAPPPPPPPRAHSPAASWATEDTTASGWAAGSTASSWADGGGGGWATAPRSSVRAPSRPGSSDWTAAVPKGWGPPPDWEDKAKIPGPEDLPPGARWPLAKNTLQELAMQGLCGMPRYATTQTRLPPAPAFVSVCRAAWAGQQCEATGQAATKRDAEKVAAWIMLDEHGHPA
ncbi:hypothetical protein PAPYR_3976 [Paratrimastix pyriformis]|uniref:DRBM domain-containing protein n=1 Tax=Paratrimastix pyriformis TaxID=342808 RepID=A0ABQ8UT45_9EUKA|nr:hypothetical protein PAPYR_3976 [Paratrimastix pyriformis]